MTSPTRKPLLILPIEERKREFLSRILIALEALECGAEVLLGQQWRIFENLDRLPPGVILFKGNNVVQATSMAAAKRAGHFVCSIEEELFAVMDAPAILRHYAPLALESCDIVFTQSANQRDVLSTAHGSARPKLKIVGNPRVDAFGTQLPGEQQFVVVGAGGDTDRESWLHLLLQSLKSDPVIRGYRRLHLLVLCVRRLRSLPRF